MSRIGKKPILIPKGVEVTRDGSDITVKGPKGSITRLFRNEVKITIADGEINLEPGNNSKFARSLWGTYGSHLKNMVDGVVKPFEKKLIIEGVGYKGEISGKNLVLSIGFSHKVIMPIPEGLTLAIEKNVFTITGINKEEVGKFAATIRAMKKPEPYKGKGIRYSDEVIRRKEGKKTA
jgi:large subunit ribosomal protein L6